MNSISVIGSSGSGKSTTARRLSAALGLPYLELDSVMHQPGWTPIAKDVFRARVDEFTRQPRWVVDGNYTSHGIADIVWPRADTVIWVDPPRWVVMGQVVRRTLGRVVTGEELWNGNREDWRSLFDPRPEKNIILWAWTRHRPTRAKYERHLADGTWDHATVIRLRRRGEIDELVVAVGGFDTGRGGCQSAPKLPGSKP